MGNEVLQQLRLLGKEAWGLRIRIAFAFAAIALITTGVGAAWPKSYSSSTTVLVEAKNIVDGLMEGRTARTEMRTQYDNAREVIYSRSLLSALLQANGTIKSDTPPADVEERIGAIRERITVSNPGENLVQIAYRDTDPDRAYDTVRALASRFIEHMRAGRTQESTAAFDFIDRQVQQYEGELDETREAIRALRAANPLAQPGSDKEVSERANELRTRIEDLEQDIREARLRERTLSEQLSGEAEVSVLSTAMDARRARIAELQTRLDTLRLSYHETYPDIVRLKQQIASLEGDLAASAGGGGQSAGGATRDNPVYQKLQEELYMVRADLQLYESRRADLDIKLAESAERAGLVQDLQAKYEKLNRDYAVNNDIYQDLLRRRENARVSVTLDEEQQALTLRVNEPAYRPHDAAGPRMLHFALGGMVLGAGLPIGLLFGFLLVDPRVRDPRALHLAAGIEVLQVIPRMESVLDRRLRGLATVFALLVGLAGIAGVAALLAGRHLGVL